MEPKGVYKWLVNLINSHLAFSFFSFFFLAFFWDNVRYWQLDVYEMYYKPLSDLSILSNLIGSPPQAILHYYSSKMFYRFSFAPIPGLFFITIWRLPYLEDESNIPSIRRYRTVHISRNEQKNLKSFNERSQSRNWNIIEDSKTYNLSKSQVCAVHHLLLLLLFFPQKVSRNFVKLFTETPCWCTNMGHQYGGRKSTKTSGFHFWDKNAFFFLVS